MFTTVTLFALLASLVNAAPLPMPAVKQSEHLATRYYNHEAPCWRDGAAGILQDGLCVLADVKVDSARYPYGYPAHGAYRDCLVPGVLCGRGVEATQEEKRDLDTEMEQRDLLPGQTCWLDGRRGYWQNGLCNLLDVDLALTSGNDGVLHHHGQPGLPFIPGQPCWTNGRAGLWNSDGLCLLAGLDIHKRDVLGDTGVVGDVLNTLIGYEDCINCPGSSYRHAVLPADKVVAADAIVDIAHDTGYVPLSKRNGLGLLKGDAVDKGLDGTLKGVAKALDGPRGTHGLLARGLLGVNHLPVLSGDGGRAGRYPIGYQSLPTDSIVDLDADLDVAGDEPYYGPGHHGLLNDGHGGLSNLKRDILGSSDGSLGTLSSIGNVLGSHRGQPPYGYTHTRYVPNAQGQLVPVPMYDGPSDLLATVDAAVDLGHTYPEGPYARPSDGRVFGSFIPNGGLLGRDARGLKDLLSGSPINSKNGGKLGPVDGLLGSGQTGGILKKVDLSKTKAI
ncbi:hypothetical protein IAU60_001068 [Kwoniella sp. DSM 27419]